MDPEESSRHCNDLHPPDTVAQKHSSGASSEITVRVKKLWKNVQLQPSVRRRDLQLFLARLCVVFRSVVGLLWLVPFFLTLPLLPPPLPGLRTMQGQR